MTQRSYWQTDTESDAIDSLSAAADFFERAANDPSYWKWSVVALHSGVQGVLALSLRQGNGLLIQKPGRTKAMLSKLAGGPGNLEPYMDNFMGLYRKAQDQKNFSDGEPPIPTQPTLDAAAEAFGQMRDDLLHFNSKTWRIDLSCLASRCRSVLSVATLVLESGVILWRSGELEVQAYSHIERALRALPE